MDIMPPLQFLNVGGDKIALRYREGKKQPGLFWLGGYRSDMMGIKACFLDRLAQERGHAMLRHDYSGHGASGGDFNEGTISCWLMQSLAVYDKFAQKSSILIGSSMGGWLALRMAQELLKRAEPPSALVLLAPAPDFTAHLIEPHITPAQQQQLGNQGFFTTQTEYGTESYSKALIEDGRHNLVLKGMIETGCPVHIIHGIQDQTVPHSHALELMAHLPLENVTLTLVHDGDHRLSREQDLALLGRIIHPLLEEI